MYKHSSLTAHHTLTAIVLILIAIFLCRGLLVVNQSIHAASPAVNPVLHAIEHGHYHEPILDHFHSEEIEITDASHLMLHAMGVIESQMAEQIFIFITNPVKSAKILHFPISSIEPPLSDLFRPPIS